VAAFAAAEGKQTIASQLRAESIAQTKREQQQEEAERAKDEARQSREAIERASEEQKK
jgi:hypothetical protein